MMFSSNQVLEVSGCIGHNGELLFALKFALELSNELHCFSRKDEPSKCVYQVTDDGRYCIGWNPHNEVKKGWNEFPFDFDINIISQIIIKNLEKQEIKYGFYDGSYRKGFLMKLIENSFDNEKNGIINPSYGIVVFEPYTCFYSK